MENKNRVVMLTMKEFMELGKLEPTPKLTEEEFLKAKYYTTDEDEDSRSGWKFKGKFTEDIDEAKKWYQEIINKERI